MPQFLYQAAYTPESLAAQIQNPEDRLATAGETLANSVGAKIIAGGFCYGEYDLTVIVEAPDEETMAAMAMAIAAGGGVKTAKTTPLLSGDSWVKALGKAQTVTYKAAR